MMKLDMDPYRIGYDAKLQLLCKKGKWEEMEQNYNGKKYNPIALENLTRELLRVATCYLKHFQIIMIFRSFLIYFFPPPWIEIERRDSSRLMLTSDFSFSFSSSSFTLSPLKANELVRGLDEGSYKC